MEVLYITQFTLTIIFVNLRIDFVRKCYVPLSAIHKANKEIEATLGKKQAKQRRLYQTHALTQDQKLHIARYASIHGTAAANCVSKKEMPEVDFKDSIMRTWRDHYQAELKKRGHDQEG